MVDFCRRVRGSLSRVALLLAVVGVSLLSAAPAWATGDSPITPTDTGIDVPGTCTAYASYLGPMIGAVIALALGFLALRKVFTWVRRLVG